MMRTINKIYQIAIAVCLLLFCYVQATAQDVQYNFLNGTNFSKYKTYKWVKVPNAQYPNQILDGQIKQAIDAQLTSKGLTKTEEDNADLYVAYQLAIDQ
jgi:hypothetical protein